MNTTRSLLFPPTSRYHNVETATYRATDGKEIAYLKRRFVLHYLNSHAKLFTKIG